MAVSDPRGADGWQPNYEPAPLTRLLSPEACDAAIEMGTRVGFQPSQVYNKELSREHEISQSELSRDTQLRQSETAWVQPDNAPELYRKIEQTLRAVNKELYRFAIYGMDPIQIVRYETGSFFNDHPDIGNGPAAFRKLSLIIQLSDPADYEGGDVIIGSTAAPRERGSGCVFPSWARHRVERLTQGTRYSLVAWARGTWFR